MVALFKNIKQANTGQQQQKFFEVLGDENLVLRWWGVGLANCAFVLARSLQNPLCSLQGENPQQVRDRKPARRLIF